jgi:thymidylate kinase
MRHLKPKILIPQRGAPVTIVADPHGKPPRSSLASLAKIILWLMEEWFAALFQGDNGAVLICDRYYHDLLIDPRRYRYGGPLWAAELVGKLMPRPSLWILLDAPTEVLQARKQEVTPEETARQRAVYLTFVQAQKNSIVIDASRPLDEVTADVARAVANALKENTGTSE